MKVTKIINFLGSGFFSLVLFSGVVFIIFDMIQKTTPEHIIMNSNYSQYYNNKPWVFAIDDSTSIRIKEMPSNQEIVDSHTIEPKEKNLGLKTVSQSITISDRDFDCFARNIFHESAGEPYLGQLAVAQVTWNRYKVGQWGSTICSVVYWPHQFSWTLDSNKKHSRPKGSHWEYSKQVARDFLNGKRVNGMERTKFFHATRINPPLWTKDMETTHVIGGHIFYAMK